MQHPSGTHNHGAATIATVRVTHPHRHRGNPHAAPLSRAVHATGAASTHNLLPIHEVWVGCQHCVHFCSVSSSCCFPHRFSQCILHSRVFPFCHCIALRSPRHSLSPNGNHAQSTALPHNQRALCANTHCRRGNANRLSVKCTCTTNPRAHASTSE